MGSDFSDSFGSAKISSSVSDNIGHPCAACIEGTTPATVTLEFSGVLPGSWGADYSVAGCLNLGSFEIAQSAPTGSGACDYIGNFVCTTEKGDVTMHFYFYFGSAGARLAISDLGTGQGIGQFQITQGGYPYSCNSLCGQKMSYSGAPSPYNRADTRNAECILHC